MREVVLILALSALPILREKIEGWFGRSDEAKEAPPNRFPDR